MKKLVIILALLMTVCAGFSQPGSTNKKDTCICVTPREMRNAIRSNDSLVVAREIILYQDSVVAEMRKGLDKFDSLVKKQDELHLADLRIINNLDSQNSTLTKSNSLSLDYNSYLKSQLKKQKRKTVVIAGMSVAVITGLSYLLISK